MAGVEPIAVTTFTNDVSALERRSPTTSKAVRSDRSRWPHRSTRGQAWPGTREAGDERHGASVVKPSPSSPGVTRARTGPAPVAQLAASQPRRAVLTASAARASGRSTGAARNSSAGRRAAQFAGSRKWRIGDDGTNNTTTTRAEGERALLGDHDHLVEAAPEEVAEEGERRAPQAGRDHVVGNEAPEGHARGARR